MRFKERLKSLSGRKRKDSNGNIVRYEEFKEKKVSRNIKDNEEYLKNILHGSKDIIYRHFSISSKNQHLLLVYVDGMVDLKLLNENVLKSMMLEIGPEIYNERFSLEEVSNHLLTATELQEAASFDKLVLNLLSGDTLVFIEGSTTALIVGSKGWDNRSVGEPTTEQNVKGAKDCFIETIRNNVVLIRRRIRDPNLVVDPLSVGRRTKSDIALVYLNGVIMEGLADEIKKRITSVDIDGVVSSGQLEQLIAGNKWTIFPQSISTERPDKAVAGILEGRAAIIVDGSPYVILVPTTFSSFLDAPDDYYENPIVTSIFRLTRYISYFISASLPGIYIAITNFHPGMLPPKLMMSITATRGALPFPTFVEMFIMESVLEILQEAGIRLPQSIGQTVSIVGGIVIGQAAVQAGLVSPLVVIVVSLTAITSFTLPSYTLNLSSRVLRIPFMIAGATLGFYGVILFAMVSLAHMASIESFGIGYFEDFSPIKFRDLKDTILRVPINMMRKRPEFLKPEDTQRQTGGKKKE